MLPVPTIIPIVLDDIRFDIEIHVAGDRYISIEIADRGEWEPFETRVLRSLCEPGGLVVDIGANIGWYSLIASACVGPTGTVVALEPEDVNYQLLRRNLARNAVTNVQARRVAVSSRSGTMPLYLSDDNRGDHRLFEGGENRPAQTIEAATLDAILADFATGPTLIKCDTQGSEWSVVQGLDPTRFDASRCAWIVEFWPYGLDGMGANASDLVAWFAAIGYRFYEVSEGNPRLVSTDPAQLRRRVANDLTIASQMFINLLLIHPDDARLKKLDTFA